MSESGKEDPPETTEAEASAQTERDAPDDQASAATELATPDDQASAATALATPVDQASAATALATPVDQASAATELAVPSAEGRAAWRDARAGVALEPRARYRIQKEVAQGGLGRVILAEDRWLGRNIALKELRPGRSGAAPRFRREAIITARLEHPAVVPVHDAGHWPSGEPFYSMKMVSGRSMAKAIRESKSLEDRLALLANVRAVADAIAYAHSKRIIHRDLKPANVMLGAFGETIVIDWGLAKDLDSKEEDAQFESDSLPAYSPQDMTVAGSVLGTPAFMSPEQAKGLLVDERTDVYALGAMLYAVLTGAPPYTGKNSSEVLARVLDGAPVRITAREPRTPPELVAIVDKAMARTPDRRYPTAAELAEDLKRFETGQLVGAHQYSMGTLLRRWVARHRAPVAVAAVAVLLIAALGTLAIRRIVQKEALAQEQRETAQEQRKIAEAQRREAESQRSLAEERANRVTLLQAESSLTSDPTAAIAWLKQVGINQQTLDDVRAIAQRAISRGVATEVLRSDEDITSLAFAPDGHTLAATWKQGSVLLWDASSGTARTLSGDHGDVISVAFSPQGTLLACVTEDGSVLLWELATGARRKLGQHAAYGLQVAFTGDGESLVSVAQSPRIFVWNPVTGTHRTLETGGSTPWDISLSPNGQWIAVANREGVTLRSTRDDATRRLGREGVGVTALAFAPDGASLAVGLPDGSIEIRPLSAEASTRLPGHESVIYKLVFSPDGAVLASSSQDGTVRVTDVGSGHSRVFSGHSDVTTRLVFDPGGERLLSASYDGTIRNWDLTSGDSQVLRGHALRIQALANAPGGLLASADSRGWLRIWRLLPPDSRLIGRTDSRRGAFALLQDAGSIVFPSDADVLRIVDLRRGDARTLRGHEGQITAVATPPASHALYSAGADGTVRRWEPDDGSSRILHRHPASIVSLAVSNDGNYYAFTGREDIVFLRSSDGDLAETFGDLERGFAGMAFSGDGGTFATASAAGPIHVVNLTDRTTRVLEGHRAHARRLSFSPDGTRLASCDVGGAVLLWTLASGEHRAIDGGCHKRAVPVFSPDGSALAIADANHAIRVTSTTGGAYRLLVGHLDRVTQVLFTGDREHLVSASIDGTIRVWDLSQGSVRVFDGSGTGMLAIALAHDESSLLSSAADGAIRLWEDPFSDPAPREAAAVETWLGSLSAAEIAPGKKAQSRTFSPTGQPTSQK